MSENNYMFKPNSDRQRSFVISNCDYVFYGGARGGGKSFILAYDAALHVREVKKDEKGDVISVKTSIDYPEYRALLCRKTMPALNMNLKPHTDKIYTALGAKYNKKTMTYTFTSGAEIALCNLKDRETLEKYIGGNYHYIGIDEVNQFPWDMVTMLFSSCRSSNKKIKPLKRMCSNPGGVGHLWLKEKFVDKCPPVITGERVHWKSGITYPVKKDGPIYYTKILNTEESWQYVPSLIFDNKDLIDNDPTYLANLLNKPEAVQKMWIYGDFGAYSGQWLNMWDERVHVITSDKFVFGKEMDDHVCVTKQTHTFYGGLDFGTASPFAFLLFAVDSMGKVVCFDEATDTGMTASQQAEYIKEMLWEKYRIEPSDVVSIVADPSGWRQTDRGGNTFRSDISYFEELGFCMVKGNSSRIQNAKNVFEFCRIKEDGLPSLRFTDNCVTAIKTIPSLPPDINNPEDVDTDGDDHCFDALKYFLGIIPSIKSNGSRYGKTFLDKLMAEYNNSTSLVNEKSWRSS